MGELGEKLMLTGVLFLFLGFLFGCLIGYAEKDSGKKVPGIVDAVFFGTPLAGGGLAFIVGAILNIWG